MVEFFSTSIFLLILIVFIQLVAGFQKMNKLDHIGMWLEKEEPVVSIIVPACNEEKSIGPALRSLCCQQYSNQEIIVVNDRSSDGTPEEIAAVKREYPFIKVVHIDHLPVGWLGKTHALQKGADCASGEYLLFTDADVCMEPTTVSRAVRAMVENRLDHLSLLFKNNTNGGLLNTLITDSGAGLLLLFKPWKVADTASRFFVGVGAFNMVKTHAYQAVKGHDSIKMQPIDDIFLGKILKWAGFRQECMRGERFVEVPWYDSVPEMVSGLMKNTYSIFNYRPFYALAGMLAILVTVIIPFGGALFSDGYSQIMFVGAVLIRIVGVGSAMMVNGQRPWEVLFLFITPFLSVYIISRAMWLTHSRGGIVWRETFYPLELLRCSDWLLNGIVNRRPGPGGHFL